MWPTFRLQRLGEDFQPGTLGETVMYAAMMGARTKDAKICYKNFKCERPQVLKNDLEKSLSEMEDVLQVD